MTELTPGREIRIASASDVIMKYHRRRRGRFDKIVPAPRAPKYSLTAAAAERSGPVRALALLQQHNQDQKDTNQNMKYG
jgi:hypothetical protein